MLSVDADAWTSTELIEVIRAGESLLNIDIEESVANTLVTECFENVYVVQEVCYRLCIEEEIYETQLTKKSVGSGADVSSFIRGIIEEQSGRYDKFLEFFSERISETKLKCSSGYSFPFSRRLKNFWRWS